MPKTLCEGRVQVFDWKRPKADLECELWIVVMDPSTLGNENLLDRIYHRLLWS